MLVLCLWGGDALCQFLSDSIGGRRIGELRSGKNRKWVDNHFRPIKIKTGGDIDSSRRLCRFCNPNSSQISKTVSFWKNSKTHKSYWTHVRGLQKSETGRGVATPFMISDFCNTPYDFGILQHPLWFRTFATPLMILEFCNTPYGFGLMQHPLWFRNFATPLMVSNFCNISMVSYFCNTP